MDGIEGKVVVITGAGSGMGEADALLLASRGARLILADVREDRLQAVTQRINDSGGAAASVVTDVRNRTEVEALVTQACDQHGQLDVLINNAGVMPISPLDDLKVDDWEFMVDVNIKGVLFGIGAALPVFRRQGYGHFVNMASTAAYLTLENQAVYSGTKFAVRAISEGLRKEAGDKIRVTIISPGYTNTNFTDTVTNEDVRAQLAASRDTFALPPEAIARAIAFAIEQPDGVDVNEIVIRSTAQA
jgi:NADP-dependent 3-hydroxy acid dehydrogenase YdfG